MQPDKLSQISTYFAHIFPLIALSKEETEKNPHNLTIDEKSTYNMIFATVLQIRHSPKMITITTYKKSLTDCMENL